MLSLIKIILATPIYIDFYLADFSDSTIMHRAAVIGVRLTREETSLNLVTNKLYRAHFSTYDFMHCRTLTCGATTNMSVLIKYGSLPHGFAEVCGKRAVVFIPKINDSDDFMAISHRNADLVKHEILHMLGASHYRGYINRATARVMRSIKQCLNYRSSHDQLP